MAPPDTTPLSDPALAIETPERIELCLEVAGLGTRALAYLVDAAVLFVFWASVLIVASIARIRGIGLDELSSLGSVMKAILVFAAFALQWGYWVLFETLWDGRSPGKRALRIRVVRLDGSPVGFVEAALRNLGRVADFLPMLYGVGLTAMMVNARSRRLGDLLAGTIIIRERRADLSRYDRAPLPATASVVVLASSEFELVSDFVARADDLGPEARDRIALKVAEPFAQRLPEQERSKVLASGAAAETFLKSLVASHG